MISLYMAPDESCLPMEDRKALEAHMEICEPCRRDCRESRAAISMLRESWKISLDTAALLEKNVTCGRHGVPAETITLHSRIRRVAVWTVAACLLIAVLGGWASLYPKGSRPEHGRPVALAGEDLPFTITLADGSRIPLGTVLHTSTSQTKRIVLNGRHQVLMNSGTRIAIEPLRSADQPGWQVNLDFGEIYVHVEHDGNPFTVRTPHAGAVITGTTFDVKVTDAQTTLMVEEGSVEFESNAGTVQVAAGQQSIVATPSHAPSPPAICDTTAMVAWAKLDPSVPQAIGSDGLNDVLRDDPLTMPSSWPEIRVDLDRIDYTRWVEHNRNWFRRQFPWVFDLQHALQGEGIEVDYPQLLMQSGEIWRFCYPPESATAGPDPNSLLRITSRFGRDEPWLRALKQITLLPGSAPQNTAGPDAFERWAKAIEARASLYTSDTASDAITNTVNAGLYLMHTRTLAFLEISHAVSGLALQSRDERLDLLQEQLDILGGCISLSQESNLLPSTAGMCDNTDPWSRLAREIRRVRELEIEVRGYEKTNRE